MKPLGLVSSILLAAGLGVALGAGFEGSACANDFATTSLKPAKRLVVQVDSDGDKDSEPAARTSDALTPNAVAEEDFKHAEMRENWEAQQTAHDKLIIDRFLLGAAVIFAVIAAALLFSLPPKPRE